MTRPIYEPSLPRTDATLGYGSDQLFRRPAPAAGATTSAFAWIRWEQGSVSIADETWINIADPFTTDYSAGFIGGVVGDPPNFSVDLNLGRITWDNPGGGEPEPLVIVTAWARWDDVVAPAFVAGDSMAVGIRTNGGQDFINSVVFPTTPAKYQALPIAVTVPMLDMAITRAEAVVFQSSGAAKTCWDSFIFAQYVGDGSGTAYP